MKLFWYWVIYSFLGFLLEVGFARVIRHPKKDRKCRLILPLCPVYGFGAVGILLLPGWVDRHPLVLWLLGGGIATGVEYSLGWFYEGTLGVKFWDYGKMKGNLQGRVCPVFGLIWGLLALVIRRWIQPGVAEAVAHLPVWAFLPAWVAVMVDGAATLAVLSARGDTGALKWYDRFSRS